MKEDGISRDIKWNNQGRNRRNHQRREISVRRKKHPKLQKDLVK